jgi:hypothetical protein
MYKLTTTTNPITKETKEDNIIIRTTDNAAIPKDEANTDYQEYLEWAKSNTPEEAD